MKKSFVRSIKKILLSGVALFATSAFANKLYVYNWTDYVPSDLVAQFTKETGVEIIYSTFESNEEMYAKLKLTENTGSGYDLVFPSSYYVNKMIKENMLQPLDKSKLSNLKQVPKHLLNKEFDPENKYSLPYVYGLTGIEVNSDDIDPKTITSWADLWKPEFKHKVLLAMHAKCST